MDNSAILAGSNGLTIFLFSNRKSINTISTTSFKNDVSEVMGKQSPKQPQFLGIPVMYV